MPQDPLAAGADEPIVGIPRRQAFPHGEWTGFRSFEDHEAARAEIARARKLLARGGDVDEVLDALAADGVPLKADREQAWKDFAGWRLVGFPGAQVLYTEAEMHSRDAFTRGPILGLQSQLAAKKG